MAKLPELLQRRSNKAVLTVVGAVYGGVNAWVSPGPSAATVEAKLASPDYKLEIMVVAAR